MNERRNTTTYPTVMDAMKGVLVETCSTIANLEYLVVGGWVPYLRSANTSLVHPGTKDVDLGFRSDQKHLVAAAKLLGAAGYVPEATTPFIRYKMLRVKNAPLIFHTDFFMKREVDIALDQNLWSMFELEAVAPSGQTLRTQMRLLSEAGLVFMKSIALWEITKANKRSRDAFDIFYVFSGASGPQAADEFKALAGRVPLAKKSLAMLTKFVQDNAADFDRQVAGFAGKAAPKNPAAQVAALLAAK